MPPRNTQVPFSMYIMDAVCDVNVCMCAGTLIATSSTLLCSLRRSRLASLSSGRLTTSDSMAPTTWPSSSSLEGQSLPPLDQPQPMLPLPLPSPPLPLPTSHSTLLPPFCSKSCTGVDWFIVDTEKGAAVRIHKAVDYWAKHIVDQIKGTHGTRGVGDG